ncbi:MAG: hypothetical protein IJY93_06085 [Clostridia bacterium]|nr:hypothetical protein [Clostridia bacterium]
MKIFGKEIKLFNFNAEGKGVKKEPEGPKNLANFFKHFANKFTRLVTVNMFIILGNFPVFFLLLGMSGIIGDDTYINSSPMFAPIHGVITHEQTPAAAALFGIFGLQAETTLPNTWTYIIAGLSILLLFTFGYVNTGTTYILRNMVKGEPIFMWDDFWYAIKRNKRQGMILGIIDLVFSCVCVYDIIFFSANSGISAVTNFMFWASIFIALLWFWMRFYMYTIMITFDLSIFKILKNSLIFALLGFKRNFMATLGIVAMLFITYGLMLVYFPLGIIMPFILLFADCAFMASYASFPKIKEVMIDPYYKDEEPEEDPEEPIFHDLG